MTTTTETQLSLIPEEQPTTSTIMADIESLPPNDDLIGPAPDSAFLESIRQFGILVPIQVVKVAGNGKVRVTDGRRRLKAARLLEMTEVPITMVAGDVSVPTLSVMANAQRSHNEASDYAAITQLLNEGYDLAGIASATGLPQQTIKKRLKLRKLVPELMALFLAGVLPISVAERATYLTLEQQDAMLALYKATGKLTMRDVMLAQRVRHDAAVAGLPADLFDGPDMDDDEEEERGRPALRTLFPEVAGILDEIQARLDAGKEPTVSIARRLLAAALA